MDNQSNSNTLSKVIKNSSELIKIKMNRNQNTSNNKL